MRILLLSTLLAALIFLGAFDSLDTKLDRTSLIGPKAALALDFFGADEEGQSADPAERDAFWRTDSGIPETQPIGIPTSCRLHRRENVS